MGSVKPPLLPFFLEVSAKLCGRRWEESSPSTEAESPPRASFFVLERQTDRCTCTETENSRGKDRLSETEETERDRERESERQRDRDNKK